MSTFEQLQRENDTLKQKNQKLEDQLGTLNVEVSTLTGRIETICAESGDINENPVVVHLQKQNTELAEQNVKLNRALEAETLNVAAMRDARDHMEGKFNDCYKEKDSLKKRLRQLEATNDTLRTETAVNAGLAQRNTELARLNAKLQSEVDRLGEENKKIDRYSAANHAYQKTIEKLRNDLRDANAINTHLMKDKMRLINETNQHRGDYASLQETYGELDAKYQALLQESYQWQPTAITDKEELIRETLDNVTHEGRISRYALEHVMMLYDAETDRVADARTEVTELRRDLKHAETLADERWTGYKKAIEDRNDARKERKSLRKRLEQAQTEVKDLRALCDTLSGINKEKNECEQA